MEQPGGDFDRMGIPFEWFVVFVVGFAGFHGVEVPDFPGGMVLPDSPTPRGRGGLGRRAIRITMALMDRGMELRTCPEGNGKA
jgi:hypothetical protein